MKKFLAWLLTPVFLLSWLVILNVFHLLQVFAFRVFGARAHQTVVAVLNGLLLHSLWLLGTRFSVHFSEKLPRNRAIIFVANHQNKLDIVGISWYLRHYSPKFVSKIELAKGLPSVSYNLRHSGAALINRSDAKQALTEIGRLGQLIEQTQTAAVIFPEGTRAPTGEMKAFNTAGIKLLLKKSPHALVVPIYIHQTWTLNRFGKLPMSVGENISWTILPAIEPEGKTPNEIAMLAEQCIRQAWTEKMTLDTDMTKNRAE
jgi:1-acyl-sn-glycerol-3-phosphate acyltransferase